MTKTALKSSAPIASHSRFEALLSMLEQSAFFTLDSSGNITSWNQPAELMLGYPSNQITGMPFSSLMPEGEDCFSLLRRARTAETVQEQQVILNQQQTGLHVHLTLMQMSADTSDGYAVLLRLHKDRHTDRDIPDLSELVYKAVGESVLVTDESGNIIQCNDKMAELCSTDSDTLLNSPVSGLYADSNSRDALALMDTSIWKSGDWQGKILLRSTSDTEIQAWLRVNTIFDNEGQVKLRTYIFSRVHDFHQAEQLIWQKANFDTVTGMPNRNMFLDRLAQAIHKSRRSNNPFALIFMDLDHFKNINDTLGHEYGDQLLQEVAERIKSCLRLTDTAARLGGDEFTILMEDLDDVYDVERVTQSVRSKIELPFVLNKKEMQISTSIGVTFFPKDAEESSTLLRFADQAMYNAKKLGRNQVSYFTNAMNEAAAKRSALVTQLNDAITNQNFILHYQPIIDLSSNRICKAEALLRWEHTLMGLLRPDSFINLAEESGAIVKIGDLIFNMVLEQLVEWRRSLNSDFQISINKSPAQFKVGPSLYKRWLQRMQEHSIEGRNLVIEITESLLLDNNQNNRDILQLYDDAGMEIAIDDFGTGYSSLSYLQRFNIDYLKIDRSFVSSIEQGLQNQAICEAMVLMAHKLGLRVIAEGVENQVQLEFLRNIGCDYAQGYLISKPVPPDEFAGIPLHSGFEF